MRGKSFNSNVESSRHFSCYDIEIPSLFVSYVLLFPILTDQISNNFIQPSCTQSCYCIQQQNTLHLFQTLMEWKVLTSIKEGCVTENEKRCG